MKNNTIKLLTLTSSLILFPMIAVALSLGISSKLVLCCLIWYTIAVINVFKTNNK